MLLVHYLMIVPFQIYENFGAMGSVHRPNPARPVSKVR
jgi:hypothetical protein